MLSQLWTRLNESYANPRARRIVAGVVIVSILLLLWRRFRGSGTAVAATAAGSDPANTKAVYLAREAARHVSDSLGTVANPLSSYYHAVHAHAMAGTARDIAPNAAALNAALGVDIHSFLEYTQRVVTEAETRLVK